MYVRKFPLFNQADGGSTAGGAADAAGAAGAAGAADAAAGAAGAGAAPANGASGGATASPGSLMARGAGSGGAGQGAAAADATAGVAGDGGAVAFPEKYLVKKDDGSTDWEASALKQAQGYDSLSKRLGTGDAPPKTPDEYAPELPTGMTMEALKTDPMFAGFLKGAHSKGLTNGQVSYILGEFQQRMTMLEQQRNSPEVGEAELQKVWATPQQMSKGLGQSFRATKTYAENDEHAASIDRKFGNDPDFIRLMAKIGAELGEDTAVMGATALEVETLETLKANPAYSDPKHPEHTTVKAKVTALYRKVYGD